MSNNTTAIPFEDLFISLPVKYIWIAGIALSMLCLVLQAVLYIIKPKIRKIDQKILTMLTVARCANTLVEFLVTDADWTIYTRELIFSLYLQTDAALICWMFLYTKILYDKVVLVFKFKKWNFLLISVLVWLLTVPLGILNTSALYFDFYDIFYLAYAWVKFIVLAVNLLFFCRIFYVIMDTRKNSQRNFTSILKVCTISFILVCITSFQVFVTDICSYLELSPAVTDSFCLVSSFQAIGITIIFLILVKNCKTKPNFQV